eukprot:g61499.t1
MDFFLSGPHFLSPLSTESSGRVSVASTENFRLTMLGKPEAGGPCPNFACRGRLRAAGGVKDSPAFARPGKKQKFVCDECNEEFMPN